MKITAYHLALFWTLSIYLAENTLAQDIEWQFSSDNVGVGTGTPTEKMHIVGDSGTKLLVENTDPNAVGDQNMFELKNAGTNKTRFYITSGGRTWSFNAAYSNDFFEISRVGTGLTEFKVDAGGNLTIRGISTAINHVNTSTREAKTDFREIDSRDVLEKLINLPVMKWRYIIEHEEVSHVGPVAEDFQQIFGLSDGKTISTVDEGGIALAAIQGLNQKLIDENNELQSKIARQDERISQLEIVLNELIKNQALPY